MKKRFLGAWDLFAAVPQVATGKKNRCSRLSLFVTGQPTLSSVKDRPPTLENRQLEFGELGNVDLKGDLSAAADVQC